jgi:hypothetical protein
VEAESLYKTNTVIKVNPIENTWSEVKRKIPDDGQRRCPKHIEFYNRIKLG